MRAEELEKIARGPERHPEEDISEDERLSEALGVLKAEFIRVAEGIDALDSVPLNEANYEKFRLIGDRISALAEISPDLSFRPDIREEFDQAVRYVAVAYLEAVGKKFAASDFGKDRPKGFSAYVAIREKLE